MARYDAKCILQWSIAVQFGAVRHTHANAFSLILTEFNMCPFSVFFTMFFFLFYPEYESGGNPTAMAHTIFTHDNRQAGGRHRE